MIAENAFAAAPSLRLHSELPDSLSRARTPLDMLAALTAEGAGHGFDLWAMAARRDGEPGAYLASLRPLPQATAAREIADFLDAANVLARDAAVMDWTGAACQVLSLKPAEPPLEDADFQCQDTLLRLDEGDVIVIRAGTLSPAEPSRPLWSRLETMLRFAAPHLRAMHLSDLNTKRGMIDIESGTYSWPYFLDALEREVERARRQQIELSLAVLELRPLRQTQFLPVALHERVGQHVGSVVRRSDLVGRIGPQSYAILFHHTGPRPALIAAGRIAEALRADDTIMDQLSFAVGVSGWERDGLLETSSLLAQASAAAAEAAVIAPDRAFVYL